MGQNALNLYPGLGDPIKSLDCTKDGRFLLATCKNYLMFMATFNGSKNGFASRIKNSEKPAPKLLRIHPSDIVNNENKNKTKFNVQCPFVVVVVLA